MPPGESRRAPADAGEKQRKDGPGPPNLEETVARVPSDQLSSIGGHSRLLRLRAPQCCPEDSGPEVEQQIVVPALPLRKIPRLYPRDQGRKRRLESLAPVLRVKRPRLRRAQVGPNHAGLREAIADHHLPL